MTKRKSRIVAVGLVAFLASVAIVTAAPDIIGPEDDISQLQAIPRIIVVPHPVGLGGMALIQLKNNGMAPVTVDLIQSSCETGMGLNPASGGTPFTIAPGGMQPLSFNCGPGLSTGMHRCTFSVREMGKATFGTTFIGVCKTHNAFSFLSAMPSSLNFGTVGVGETSAIQTFQLNNNGSAGMDVFNLQLQLDNDNFLIGMPCNPDALGCDATGVGPMTGSATTIAVMCKPTATGVHVGQLHAVGSNGVHLPMPVSLSCTGGTPQGPTIQVSPTTLPLGNVEVVGGSANGLVTVRNVGSGSGSGATLSVDGLQLSSSIPGATMDWNFLVSGQCVGVPCTLAPSQQINLSIDFNPNAIGPRTTDLIVEYNDGAPRTETVQLQGTGVAPTLELVSGATIDFGVVPINTVAMQSFTVANNGNRPLTDGTITPNPPGPPFTIQANPLLVPVSPPNTVVNVMCSSPTPITANTNIVVEAPDALGGGFSVNLKCEVRDTQLAVNPTSTQLGEIRTGTGMRHELYSVTSLGAPIAVTSVALSSTNPNVSIVSPAGAATTPFMIDLLVNPVTDSAIDTSIVITPTNPAVMPIAIPVTGLVTTAAYDAPPEVSLGTFCVGQNTSATNVVLTSTGTATIQLSEPALQMSPAPFDLAFASPVQYPASLPGGGQAMVQVTPKRSMMPGPVDDVLVWTTDATPMTRNTTLRATFVDDGGAIAPTMLDFGRVPIHVETPNGQKVTLQNCDTSPLDIDNPIHVDKPFAIQGTMPTRLEPGESATINVVFLPTKVGPATGVLEVTAQQLPGQKLTVALSGEGFVDGGGGGGDDDGGYDGDRTSFYACGVCNSSNPTGMFAVMLGLGIALIPRRKARRAA